MDIVEVDDRGEGSQGVSYKDKEYKREHCTTVEREQTDQTVSALCILFSRTE
jgi:hypothetical protein